MGYLGQRSLGSAVSCCHACDEKVRWTFFHCREAEIADISEKREQKRYINKKLYQTLVKKTGEKHAWGNMTGVRPTKMIMERLEEGSSEEEIMRNCFLII